LLRNERAVRTALLRWAPTVDRPLPWRGELDPYRVLVSEVMLQQTQADRVAKAYPEFLARFPSVEALAGAEASDILRAWGDLGYNRRAVYLWRAARAVVDRGGFPDSVVELETLPGVGRYTARAIASFAFGEDAEVVEANVRRIITRLAGLPADTDVWNEAKRLLPPGRAPTWNQALMDLGALHCRPRDPICTSCPLQKHCAWVHGTRPEAARRSPAVRFESTSRYARGRIVRALREAPGPLGMATLAKRTGLERQRLERALEGLDKDGVVRKVGGRIALGN
jgi:A/G-specific adenine glycosylase